MMTVFLLGVCYEADVAVSSSSEHSGPLNGFLI